MSDLPPLEVGTEVIVVSDYNMRYVQTKIDRVTPKRAYVGNIEIDRVTWVVRGNTYNTPTVYPLEPHLVEKAAQQRLMRRFRQIPVGTLSSGQLVRIIAIMEES